MNRPIYLDYAATTPMSLTALEALFKCLGVKAEFGNPHSASHEYGFKAAEVIAEATLEFAELIDADPSEIIWTSGATESNNLAIQGVARFYQSKGRHIITSQIEHRSVLDVFRYLEQEGFDVTYLPVQRNGLINLKVLKSALRDETTLVSIHSVNNELGTIEPIQKIAEIVKGHGAYFHTDAAQALGKIPFNVNALDVDLASFSGHKVYGPKGIGALYVRRNPRVRLKPLLYGGGQQGNIRPGTEAPALINAFAKGATFAAAQDLEKMSTLRDLFLQKLNALKQVKLNTDLNSSVPHIINLQFLGINSEVFLNQLKDNFAIAQGSACASVTIQPSHVLKAIGLKSLEADNSFRFSFGAFTTLEEVEKAADLITKLLS